MLNGSCLCGAVRFQVTGTPTGASVCHCGQCRKQSGHVWSSAQVPRADLALSGAKGLRWYHASKIARRGFCGTCGSFLFWDETGDDNISFALGAIDGPTGLRLEKHIFTADKGDYYVIADDIPQS